MAETPDDAPEQQRLGQLVAILGWLFALCLTLGGVISLWAGETVMGWSLLGAAVLAGLAFWGLSRLQDRMLTAEASSDEVLHQLEDLHRRGEVDTETLERARAAARRSDR